MQNNKENVIEKTVDILELSDCLMQLNFINDNLHLVRWGLVSGECIDPKTIDNALYLINQNIESVIERIDAAMTTQKS